VAFNVQGHCYSIAEDGVETDNTVQYNLAVKIHPIGTPPASATQFGPIIVQGDEVDPPADTAAAGFYLTNKQNRIIGNAASWGSSGCAMPFLPRPILTSQNDASRSCYVPMDATTIEFRGNSAHSSGCTVFTQLSGKSEGICTITRVTFKNDDKNTTIWGDSWQSSVDDRDRNGVLENM